MKSTDELHPGELARRAEEFRSACQDRDVERMLALFADDAEVTMAPGTFRGKAAIRKFFEWEVRMAPVATSTDAGLGMAVAGRTVVWECQISETVQGVPYTTEAVRILEFDDAGLIRRYRSYYDKLAVMEKIASGMSGASGWVARALIGFLVARGQEGLGHLVSLTASGDGLQTGRRVGACPVAKTMQSPGASMGATGPDAFPRKRANTDRTGADQARARPTWTTVNG